MNSKSFLLIVIILVMLSSLALGQSDKSELNESLSWLPQVYEGGNVYKGFKYTNIEMLNSLDQSVYSLDIRRNKQYLDFPAVFRENISTNLSVTAFSSGFRTLSSSEKAAMTKHLKKRKDIPAEIRKRLMENVATETSQGKEVDWQPEIFTLKNGQESFNKMLAAKLFEPTGEKLEGYEIYVTGKQLNLNREAVNWLWFDGDKTILTSNIVDNLALMIFAKQGNEQTVLDVKENIPFFEKGYSKDILTFTYFNFKAIFDQQYSKLLSEGIPEKELGPTKEFADASYRYTVETGKLTKGEIIYTREHQFGSSTQARDNEQGESWYKKQLTSGSERYKDIDRIERNGSVVYITTIYKGDKLKKYFEKLSGADAAELIKSKSRKRK